MYFFYTDQNRQTRFYPKKGRNSRPFYHLTKKIQNGQKLPKNGLISPIYFSSKLFTPTCQFYTDILQLWQRTDTLKKLSPTFVAHISLILIQYFNSKDKKAQIDPIIEENSKHWGQIITLGYFLFKNNSLRI